MNLPEVFHRFPTQESCIEHLEDLRWGHESACPLCGGMDVARKDDGGRVGRWNCHDCRASFNVLSGTIFCKTRVPLQKWFLAICLMVNAKKSLSSHQLARDLDLTQQTALYVQLRIRAAMAAGDVQLLQGIVEADETYIGGRPRKGNRRENDKPSPRGRGTSKTPVIGVVERGGKVKAKVAEKLTGKDILRFIKDTVDPQGSVLITDEYKAYREIRSYMHHATIDHSVSYADGDTHTNTIEGFWSLLKRAWYGTHHHYSKSLTSMFVAEASWKYNHRRDRNAFGSFLRECMV